MKIGSFVFIKEDKDSVKKFEVGIIEKISNEQIFVKFSSKRLVVDKQLLVAFDINKTGDGYDKKICNRCFRILDTSEFQKNQNGKNNRTVRRPSCNDCRKIIDGKEIPPKIKKEWDKVKPNLIIWECPICHKKSIPGLTSKIVIDHNHKTGLPRDYICESCNTGLGRFNDDIDILKNAINYLIKHNK